jgi:glycosyltransferase involved in cell wall biosynthesis
MSVQEPVPSRTIWLLSPYHTGSHRAWADGYRRHSRHRIELLTMAGRFWKWRMQGGAVELAEQARDRLAAGERPDLILATDMVNLPAWLGFMRGRLSPSIPIVLYMHENQLTYPWRPGEKPDLTYAMINWLSQQCADHILFNSRYHLESWFDEAPRLLKHFPDYNHLHRVETVAGKSRVLPVGIEAAAIARRNATPSSLGGPLILWNQRWEYDKRPDRFFDLLYRLEEAGVSFRVAVAGENFRNIPAEFERARLRLEDRIDHWGYVDSRRAYVELLAQADLVISTAEHEFFGISILEAVAAGAFPLLPNRLSYPELIPTALHPACLYGDEAALFRLARRRLLTPRPAPPSLRDHVIAHFDWRPVAAAYDALVDELLSASRSC